MPNHTSIVAGSSVEKRESIKTRWKADGRGGRYRWLMAGEDCLVLVKLKEGSAVFHGKAANYTFPVTDNYKQEVAAALPALMLRDDEAVDRINSFVATACEIEQSLPAGYGW